MNASNTPSSAERKLMFVDEHKNVLALFGSSRFWVLFGISLVPAFCAAVYRAWMSFAVGPLVCGLVLAAGICVIGVQSALRGRIITNKGIFLRRREPVRFWFSVVLLVFMYGAAILVILKA